ncbi:hypothetical protein [Xanthomonas phaseoli]|uniref:hypothetical protein n=1 Tax=Xanthomonas phaseoli TaxID=1985254 RepID=UPI00135F12FD
MKINRHGIPPLGGTEAKHRTRTTSWNGHKTCDATGNGSGAHLRGELGNDRFNGFIALGVKVSYRCTLARIIAFAFFAVAVAATGIRTRAGAVPLAGTVLAISTIECGDV